MGSPYFVSTRTTTSNGIDSTPYCRRMDALKPFVVAVDHVGVAVPALDEAVAFYRDTLGLELAHDEVNEAQGVHEAMMRAPGDDGTGTAVQLLAPVGPDSTIAKFIDRKGPGL